MIFLPVEFSLLRIILRAFWVRFFATEVVDRIPHERTVGGGENAEFSTLKVKVTHTSFISPRKLPRTLCPTSVAPSCNDQRQPANGSWWLEANDKDKFSRAHEPA